MTTTLDELVDTFELLGDWEERYRYLIDLGRKLPPLPAAQHDEAHRVRGCLSQVWLACRREAGEPVRLRFAGDSDAHIVKGLIALLFKLVDGRSPRAILDLDIGEAFDRLGLGNHITVNRRNGFYAMVGRIKAFAAEAAGTPQTESTP